MQISVAMCTYNGARFLREQLDSIATQTRPPDELVISDDQSTDTTRDIIADFTRTAAFPVRLFVNETNLGTVKNFERVIGLAEGEIIVLSDQDDIWYADKLLRLEERFQTPTVGLVFTDAQVVDQELQPLGYNLWESVGFDAKQKRLVETGRAFDAFLPGWSVTGTTMAIRSQFKQLVSDIPTGLPIIHDGWIALLIASVADVVFIDEPLIKYRQHESQQIGAKERKLQPTPTWLHGARAAMRRHNRYQNMIAIAMTARQQLTKFGAEFNTDNAIKTLDDRLRHLKSRATLPAGRLSRARCILRELFSRRYHLYSNGVYSAVKDLLR
jgi:glycosyltransferase involved in cell wall biosynthesis